MRSLPSPPRLSILVLIASFPFALVGCGATSDTGGGYPEQDIRFLVGTSAGGGFDAFARTLAPYLEEKLPGDATVTVENLTGAGGLRAANTLYTAPPDGYTIGITNTIGLAAAQVSGQTDLDLNRLTWIGRLSDEPTLVLVNPDSGFESMEDLKRADRELRAAVTSLGASTGVGAVLIGDAYDLQWTPVTHEGSSEAALSLIRRDTDFMVDSIVSRRDDIESGELRPVLSIGQEPLAELPPEVPTTADDGYEDLETALSLARDIAAPPDLPEDVRNTLTQAFQEAVNDPEFRAEIEESQLDLAPSNARETEEAVAATLEVYAQYEELLTQALNEGQ